MLFTYLRNIPRNCTTFHHPYCEYLDPSPLIPRIPLITPILASSHPFLHTKVSTVHLKCKSHYDIYMVKLSNSSILASLQVTAEALRVMCIALCDSPSLHLFILSSFLSLPSRRSLWAFVLSVSCAMNEPFPFKPRVRSFFLQVYV